MAQREETRLHPIFEEGKLVAERFEISKHIGQGGYGDIYSALDTKTGHPCAVKVEYLDAEKQALLEEIRIMINLRGSTFFANLISDGVTEDFRFLAMDLFGPSLSGMRRAMPNRKYTVTTAMLLSIDMVNCIEALHKKGYLHRDVKPGNFLIRPSRKHPVCLIDFGLSQSYLTPNSRVHISFYKYAGFTGTARYASLHAHKEMQLSRRDDMISWFYSVIELVEGRLPWPGSRDLDETIRMKKKMSVREMSPALPWQFTAIWRLLKRLRFKEEPNYKMVRWLIRQAIKGFADPPYKFDWEKVDQQVVEKASPIPLVMEDDDMEESASESSGRSTEGGCGCVVA